jgi:histone-lysine N-methyltransferase SETD1
LYASKAYKQNDFVIEYIGEKIRNPIADLREEKYIKEGFGDCFLFRIDKNEIIDATFKGNQARYLNHSCDVSKFFWAGGNIFFF